MNVSEIPTEFGHVGRRPVALCSECREVRVKVSVDDPEPLCWGCRTRDDLLPGLIFGGEDRELRERREQVRELVVPVERASLAPRVFGSGSGEIESCALVQSMRHDHAVDRDAAFCRTITWAFFVLEGLFFLAAAAMR